MTKVRHVANLSVAAKALLQHIEHTSRKIAGTQETRRQMRFDTHAMRVRYGVPIFVTFTPDEGHNLIMIRLSRTRRKDPALDGDESGLGRAIFGSREPPVARALQDDAVFGVPANAWEDCLPAYGARRAILARDPLASVDGFRLLCEVVFEHLWGVRMCPYCPKCNTEEHLTPCHDMLGSSATAEGGTFGRVDAVYASREAQKSKGSLHAHSQVFVQ